MKHLKKSYIDIYIIRQKQIINYKQWEKNAEMIEKQIKMV